MLKIIVLTLAVWRISNLLVDEAGPYGILHDFRYKIGVRYNEHNQAHGLNEFAQAFTCVWCLSVWTGLAFSGLYWYSPGIAFNVSLPFALSAGAIIIKERMT